MRSVLILLFLLPSVWGYTQNIKGIVLDSQNNEPLIGVHVYFIKINEGTSTNSKGEFNLKIHSKINIKDTIQFSCIGYKTKKITYNNLEENKFIIPLSVDIHILKEVTIVPKLLKSNLNYTKLTSITDGLYSFGSLIIGDQIYVISGDASYKEDMALEALSNYANNPNFIGGIKPDFSWEEFKGSMYIYDINTDKWRVSNLSFRERAYHNIHFYNNKIYVIGGKRLSTNRVYEYLDDKIEVYYLKSDTILIDNVNPHQAVNFASFVYNKNIIIAGGSTKLQIDGQKEYSNKVHVFNLETGYWFELKDMPKAKETKGVLIHNKIYFIGGFNFQPLKEIETYDLITSEWEIEGELFRGMERPAITFYKNIIYIFEDERINTYNVETKELNEYLIDLPLLFSELFFANNKLYLLGGYIKEDFRTKPSSDLYSIDIKEFEKTKVNKCKVF
ncbi:MAG: carboxypeptidase-like regulatory domain-containing protein [Bacteroidales bacterium]|nr:carboxypeptidase-like regulatory domain-containing protein [Bacteroidales bacterium]